MGEPAEGGTEGGTPRVVIVGAGFGGIAAAIELRRHGFRDVTILERAPELGGTWYHNTYPGAACDVPSHLYSFSYEQRQDWTRLCSPQEEILDYMRGVVRAHGLTGLIRTGTHVTSCAWDEQACRWTAHTATGESYDAEVLVVATGQLDQPAFPEIEGAEQFAGHSFHSAEWDHDYALAGRRVAVVGTGASAVQFVPEIAPVVARLDVYQRTPNWFLPRRNRRYPLPYRLAIERLPRLQQMRRRYMFEYTEALTAAIRHPRTLGRLTALRSAAFMRMQLKDPELRRRAWPDYTFGCKRILFSSFFLPALERPNVELVTDAIERIVPEGIVTSDGSVRPADCIIWASGFRTNDFMFPMEIEGSDGHRLRDAWQGGAHAHLGMTVPGFPNMFILYGPNTNTSGGSIIFYLEQQARYIRSSLQALRARGAAAMDIRPDVEAAFNRDLQARFAGTAWMSCRSWYKDERGRIVANWPGYMREYEKRTRVVDPAEFRFIAAPERVAA